ncbi:hypothetical protein ABZ464_50800 [Streptomyces sp. NPDC005820]|uniref:hypothetical protein n=1 Tax=Streptomyces sp. NPDC005820 TaxID=3157069 RepID=UPI00340B270E
MGLRRFTNADGPYYAADCDFHPDGTFTALHLYPATDVRPRSGYTDATRPLLNTLLAHKRRHGVGRRDEYPAATDTDVTAVLDVLVMRILDFDQTCSSSSLDQVLEDVGSKSVSGQVRGRTGAGCRGE